LLPCCSDALITRVVLILTMAGDAFSIMSAKELESWLARWVLGLVSARATTETGALVREATAKAAISPPPIEAATSPRIAVVRRNWITFDISLENPFLLRPAAAFLYLGRITTRFDLENWLLFPLRNNRLLLRLFCPEGQARTFRICINPDRLPRPDLSGQQALGERRLDFPLDRAL
jgi:hypothetical protein